jgi:hypothetical protein
MYTIHARFEVTEPRTYIRAHKMLLKYNFRIQKSRHKVVSLCYSTRQAAQTIYNEQCPFNRYVPL